MTIGGKITRITQIEKYVHEHYSKHGPDNEE